MRILESKGPNGELGQLSILDQFRGIGLDSPMCFLGKGQAINVKSEIFPHQPRYAQRAPVGIEANMEITNYRTISKQLLCVSLLGLGEYSEQWVDLPSSSCILPFLHFTSQP